MFAKVTVSEEVAKRLKQSLEHSSGSCGHCGISPIPQNGHFDVRSKNCCREYGKYFTRELLARGSACLLRKIKIAKRLNRDRVRQYLDELGTTANDLTIVMLDLMMYKDPWHSKVQVRRFKALFWKVQLESDRMNLLLCKLPY